MRRIRVLLLSVLFALAALGASSGGVLAYGRADQPLAQIELSANCNNASFPLCAPPPAGFGTGGIWLWIEIDTGGTADVAGAACMHQKGVGGGASSIRGEVPWVSFHGTLAELATAFPGTLATGSDPGGNYYVLPAFGFAFPQTVGHYSVRLATGVFIQSQVAP